MAVLLAGSRSSSYLQLVTVLLVFVLVLAVTAFTTKWIARYQKQQGTDCNMEVMETIRISSNKYLQLVRIGQTFFAIAVCRDTVTLLGEIPKEQLVEHTGSAGGSNFKELLERLIRKDTDGGFGDADKPKE